MHNSSWLAVLQSEATPGPDEMNPTVKRSGWHAPEDSGLWAIADRVAAEVHALRHRMFGLEMLVYHCRQQSSSKGCCTSLVQAAPLCTLF